MDTNNAELREYLSGIPKAHYPNIVMILKKALGLLSRRGGWTHQANAKNAKGDIVITTSEEACRFCASGAIVRGVHEVRKESGVSIGDWIVAGILKSVIFENDESRAKYGCKEITANHLLPFMQTIHGSNNASSIIYWNDAMVSKKSQVLAAFRDAIEIMEKVIEEE